MMEFSAVNTIWVLLGAALVFFMQAGFAMVETGFTRAKNAGNIIMKNLMDFAIGTPLFWLTGFGIMFGGAGAFIGGFDPLVRGDYSGILPAGVPLPAYLIFQTVFCATAATIVSVPWRSAPNLFLTVSTALLSAQWFILYRDTGFGAAVGWPGWGFTISRDPQLSICAAGLQPDWSQDTGTAYRKVH